MSMTNGHKLTEIVASLCDKESYNSVYHRHSHDVPMPSTEVLVDVVENLRSILFPGYFGPSEVTPETMPYYTGAQLDRVFRMLTDQIKRGFCFVCTREELGRCGDCEIQSQEKALDFLKKLPDIRHLLSTDVLAAYDGDPAAKTHGETIFCYPSIKALTNHRIAHELYSLGVDIIPRIIGEMAHSETGIDIHPGATIGERFFIDHGTGTVIGETAVIGNNVRLYQGVTLGAKSFPKDEKDRLVKGLPRHPIVEDDVIIYAGATILGRVTIGHGAIIGGNVWVTEDIPAGARVLQRQEQTEPQTI
ncbi:MAG: serine O-acetyltransferase EpsC [Desulfovibrionales bacterium]